MPMKKIIAFISAVFMLFSFASCNNEVQIGDTVPDEVEQAQGKIIASLGITQKDSRIVAYQCENDYVKYVVAYYKNGQKTDESTHMFYTNDNAFNDAKEKMKDKDEVTEISEEKRYITYWSGVAYYATYAEDLELISSEYEIK